MAKEGRVCDDLMLDVIIMLLASFLYSDDELTYS